MSFNRGELVVGADAAGKRIDVYLSETGNAHSRSAAARLVEDGHVLVDGTAVRKSHILEVGERVAVNVPLSEECDLIPEDIPLDIRYEDEHMIVLSKQAGLVVHPAYGNWTGTLVHALLAHCGGGLGTLQGDDRPGIVHRLDKDTTGLMMVAKSDAVQAALSELIKVRAIDRRYLALVHGYIAPDSGLIDAPLGRDSKDRMRMAVVESPGSRQAVTTFRVLERFMAARDDDGYTLVECKLYTGRTHQIRVHMAYTHHPVVGDQLYGRRKPRADKGLSRQFLHAYRLSLDHPVTGESLEFLDPLPADLAAVLAAIKPDSMGVTDAGEETFRALSSKNPGSMG
ncbi:MAG: RluA family pseudouridine synthase [Clostridiales bacterium]|nr:RluA family pseudouridine synthase [Clostridiales bacterium]